MRDIKIKKQYAPSDRIFDIIAFIFLALVVIMCVYPFWNIFIISINDATDAIRGGIYFLPRKLSIASYEDILTRSTFLHSILVTVLRTGLGTPLAVLATTALAYVLSRQELLCKKPITLLFIFTMYFGGGLVPYYMVLKNLNMLDHFIVFIFPNLISVYNMILVRNYIEGMPQELFESSKIDGANDLIIFTKIILPLCKPIIMTIALFVAIMHWNSWFDAYLYTNSQSLKVMQSVLVEILNQYQTTAANQAANRAGQSVTPDSIRMAATMVATIPIIMVYPFIQKYFVKGIMLGAVKS
ncbi:carbohydrate ABC transporter permease [Anaerocolumna chitinilytica]|uniref:Sugar ABC transporter permease n=1 Tax=Anaerocolumna chitinilytica TaxID=1727145 RepID=A0A7M3S997_9FIRM|nr:carbohydrate ABC transporter permease [Anaerocolumna chitinilytica]BCK01165.1 sugar ABC transporter permease [Anaerocolumna chitinilytica]